MNMINKGIPYFPTPANFFDEEELTIIRRARNTKGHKPPKGCDLATYHFATAFEAVIGYLYLKGDNKKIMNLMEKIEME
jgi:ribonuclease-3 family protein